MGRSVRTDPDPEEIAAKRKRRIEVVFFVTSAVLIVTITLTFLIRKNMDSEENYCGRDSKHQVKINGNVDPDGGHFKSSDGTIYSPGQFWVSDDKDKTKWGCPCLLKPCVNKCCAFGEAYYWQPINGTTYHQLVCEEQSSPFDITMRRVHSMDNIDQNMSVATNHFYVIPNLIPCNSFYHVTGEENENLFLLEDGRIYMKDSLVSLRDRNQYCMESINGSTEIQIIMCMPDYEELSVTEETQETEENWRDTLRLVGIITSLPCLLATVLTYLVLPQLRNLHGKALVCHAASLTIAYSGLTITFLEQYIPGEVCTTIGYVILFSTLASFFWLNVMSFDIWWVFSGLMPMQGTQKHLEQLKFRLYSTYAWGSPLVITVLALIVDFHPSIPHSTLRPAMGVYSCFFEEKDPRMLFLYLPIGVVVYLNTAMFLTTSLRFKKHSRCVKRLQRGDSRRHCRAGKSLTDVQRFSLYIKLSVVMGLNWILEVADFLCDTPHPLWLIAEMANALQGLPILYMFVCKPRILAMLNQRLCPSLRLFSTERSTRTLTSSIKSNTSTSSKPRKGSDAECQLSTVNAESSA